MQSSDEYIRMAEEWAEPAPPRAAVYAALAAVALEKERDAKAEEK